MLHNNQLIDRIYIERKDSEVFLWKTSNSIYNFCSMKHTNGSCFVFFIKHFLDALQPFVLIHRNWSKGLSIRVSLPPVPHKFLDDKGFKTMKKLNNNFNQQVINFIIYLMCRARDTGEQVDHVRSSKTSPSK